MTTAAALTSGQLAKLRADKQFSLPGLAFPSAPTVYAARVNQTFTTHDLVAQLAIDSGSGTVGNVLPGMTVMVGTTAGGHNVGFCRVRKAWSGTVAYIGEGSEIAWADNLYLTVIDDFQAWAKHVRIISNVAYMDYDVAYSNQHTVFEPVPILGPDVVAFRSAGTVTIAFNSSSSYVPGGAVASRSWSVSPATGVTISSAVAANPNITFTNAGTYRISCALTSAAGKTFTGHRTVVIDPPQADFTLGSCQADFDQGFWSFDVTLWDADLVDIRDRQKVILYARDYYQGVEGSIGYTAGRENIIAQGWIEGESIVHDPAQGAVTFRVSGLAAWLGKITGYPVGVESTADAASAWTNFNGLTVDKALYHLFHWRSTLTAITDVVLTGDTRISAKLSASSSNLLSQVATICGAILAGARTDRHGRLFAFIDYNLLPSASRASVPTVMAIQAQDRAQGLEFDRRIVNETSQVDLSGIISTAGGQGSAIFSLAPGRIFKRLGNPQRFERLALTSQTQANELAGLICARDNNEFPDIPIQFTQINRAFDIAPIQRASISLAATDNARGVAYAGNLIPKRIQYQYDPTKGILTPTISFEGETFVDLYTNGDIPIDDTGTFWTPPPFIPPPMPPIIPIPPSVAGLPRFVFLLTSLGLFYTETFDLDDPVWVGLNEGFSEKDFTDGFRFLDVNQNGRYYVGTKRQVFSGVAGWPAYNIASESFWLLNLPPISPYFVDYQIYGVGCNPAADDEYGVMAAMPYPQSFGRYWFGSSAGLTAVTTLTDYTENQGSISWGPNGVLLTYSTGVGFAGRSVRMAFDGLTEDYVGSLPAGNYENLFHNRQYNADRILTLPRSGTAMSMFITDDGETVESTLTKSLRAAGYDETALKLLCVEATAPYKSTDGGQNFDPFALFPKSTANNSIIQCMGGDAYVWALRGHPTNDVPGVMFTSDFGETFLNKTGNLFNLIGTDFSMVGLKAFL